MTPDTIVKITTVAIISLTPITPPQIQGQLLASHEISLDKRYEVQSVSDVMKDNILLNLAYMRGTVSSKNFSWDEVKKPFYYEFKLDPNKTFAFHDDVLDKYKDSLVKTTAAHFNAQEGFKTDGYLYGDGVCHLASLIYWVSKEAGLEAVAPVNHDFMPIPEIDRVYGVSIYSNPFSKGSNAQQNLYITNNKQKPITFTFEYNTEDRLRVSIWEDN